MSDHRPLTTVSIVAALSLVAGCATGRSFFPPDTAARPAQGTPPRFRDAYVVVTPFQMGNQQRNDPGAATGTRSAAPPACRTKIVDPTSGKTLKLVRSERGSRGDYEVPDGEYGVTKKELLRVNCLDNTTVGIVPR